MKYQTHLKTTMEKWTQNPFGTLSPWKLLVVGFIHVSMCLFQVKLCKHYVQQTIKSPVCPAKWKKCLKETFVCLHCFSWLQESFCCKTYIPQLVPLDWSTDTTIWHFVKHRDWKNVCAWLEQWCRTVSHRRAACGWGSQSKGIFTYRFVFVFEQVT